MSFERRSGVAIVVLAALSVLPFLRAASAFFVADDLFLIPPLAAIDAPVADFAWNAITRLEHVPTTFYRPLPFVALWLEARTFGMRPEVMHLTNVALHAGAVIALFLLARRLLTGPRRDRAALLAAAAFALIPRRVEPVVWISARPDMLASCGIVIAVWLLVESRQPSRSRRAAIALLAGSTAATWGAFLSKESVFLIPLAAIAALVLRGGDRHSAGLEGAGLQRPGLEGTGRESADLEGAGLDRSRPAIDGGRAGRDSADHCSTGDGGNPIPGISALDLTDQSRRRAAQARVSPWLWAAPLLLSLAAYPILRTVALGGGIGGYAAGTYDLSWKLLTHPAKYAAYPVLPPLDLIPSLAQSPWGARVGGLCMAVILLSLIATIVWRRACLCARLGAAWLAAACLPVLAFTPSLSTTFNDRFLYLPGIGIALLLASALACVRRRAIWIGIIVFVCINGALTTIVVERWRLAGALTARIGAQLADRLAHEPGDAPIFLAAVPDSLAGAYVLRTGVRELAALAGAPRPERLVVLTHEFMEGPPRSARSTVIAGVTSTPATAAPPGGSRLTVDSLHGYPAVRLAGPIEPARLLRATPPADSLERRQQAEFALPGTSQVWIVGAAGVQEVPMTVRIGSALTGPALARGAADAFGPARRVCYLSMR